MPPTDFSDHTIVAASRLFLSVLALPCKAHDAKPGNPCWTIEPDYRAACGRRIRARVGGRR